MVSRQFDFTRKSKGKFPFVKNSQFIQDFGRNCWINGPNEASFD